MSAAPDSSRLSFGFVEWFRLGDQVGTERVLGELRRAGCRYLRTHLSWAEYHTPGGEAWYDWLLPKLAQHFEVLPCVHYTPPSLSRTGRANGAPNRLQDYADFVDHVLTRYGSLFREVELWNEPNNLLDWDWRADPEYDLFCEMVGAAAFWTRQRGWRAVLGGPCPFDPRWLDLMGTRGVLAHVDAVGMHGFPGTWDSDFGSWHGWEAHLGEMRTVLDRYNPAAEVWITEAGYSTWRNDESRQVAALLEALRAPADRMYWYGWQDVPANIAVQEGLWFDQRHYHLGAVDATGRPKLLARLLTEAGAAKLHEVAPFLALPALASGAVPTVITGGCGFIGSNLADALLSAGQEVVVADNLSRAGVEANLAWLCDRHGPRVHPALVDVRDPRALEEVVAGAKAVVHLAAQTAVTTSLDRPLEDFEINARGTLNMLEAVRKTGRRVPVILASTNKVYGGLEELPIREMDDRYIPEDPALRAHGVGEDRPLDFCTPYGCSKGVADQYVLDYARSYGIPAAVLRMSCIYGPRQFGTEDQGWVAHFLIRALEGEPIAIYGDGKQVRDILHVQDAVAAYIGLLGSIEKVAGQAFNLGGGPHNAVSLRMVIREIERVLDRDVEVTRSEWRPRDQLWFVADTQRLSRAIGWSTRVAWRDGLRDLADWLEARVRPQADVAVAPRRSLA